MGLIGRVFTSWQMIAPRRGRRNLPRSAALNNACDGRKRHSCSITEARGSHFTLRELRRLEERERTGIRLTCPFQKPHLARSFLFSSVSFAHSPFGLSSSTKGLLHPPPARLIRGLFTDLTFTKAELIAENALLRHQLGSLQRHVKRPHLTRRDRFKAAHAGKSRPAVEGVPAYYPAGYTFALASGRLSAFLEIQVQGET